MSLIRRRVALQAALAGAAAIPMAGALGIARAASRTPVRVGVDAEFGLIDSTSAQAIELGMRIAVAEINAGGGVLGGRPLELVVRDNRSMPARAMANLQELAAMDDLVAVFGGKFSPVVLDAVPLVHQLRLPFIAVWSSADPIISNAHKPSYVFRVGLRDSLAMPKMLATARSRDLRRVGLLLANTGWGRSNLAAAQRYMSETGSPELAEVAWFNWGETSLLHRYQSLRQAGAQAVLVVGNDDDVAGLVREMAELPASERLPLLCHQGITGGRFAKLAQPALRSVDLSVLQTFSFFNLPKPARERFLKTSATVAGIGRIEDIEAPTGVAHAYDALHIVARAVNLAGRTERSAVRDALERVPEYRGLIRHYRPPFTPERHEALGSAELLMARYRDDGVLVPATDQ